MRYILRVKCSWARCEASFEGDPPAGWKLVAWLSTQGSHVVVCPEHSDALRAYELKCLLKMAGLPRAGEGFDEPEEPTTRFPSSRPLKP